MNIRELSHEEEKLLNDIAILHKKAFPGFFLTQLGLPFLRTLYRGYLNDNKSGIIIAVDKSKIIGFAAYSNDYPKFYKNLIKKQIIQFAWCSFLATVRHPSFAKRLFGAFGKSESVVKREKYVELASICSDPEYEGKGIGTALIDYLKSIVDFSIFSFISLETDADNNDRVNRFYVNNGFSLEREYYTSEGRRMNEYHYAPGEKKR